MSRVDLGRRLEDAPELLDDDVHDVHELEESLDQVAEVNRLLGGTRAIRLALDEVVPARTSLHLLDIGTGSADIPRALVHWSHRRGVALSITATDVHPQMRAIATQRTETVRDVVRVEDADARALPYDADSFDVALLSLALHHFDGRAQLDVLREAARVARRAVIVNELERCAANWHGARLLAATRWRRNRLTRHDGPLSVRRAFTMTELNDIARRAGLRVESQRRRFFFRLVLIVDCRTPGRH